ncbi:MAG: hypothetical protein QMC17_05365 [Paracoccaceae bacterium]|jgi:hypothetical protein
MFMVRALSVVFQRHVFMSLMLTTAAGLVIAPAIFELKQAPRAREALAQANLEREGLFEVTILGLKTQIGALNEELGYAQDGTQSVNSMLAASDQELKVLNLRIYKKDQEINLLRGQIENYVAKLAAHDVDNSIATRTLAPLTAPALASQRWGYEDKNIGFSLALSPKTSFKPLGLSQSLVEDVKAAEVTLELVVVPVQKVIKPSDLVPEKLRRAMLEEWSPPMAPSVLFEPQTSNFALGLMGGGPEPIVLLQEPSLPYGATTTQSASTPAVQQPVGFGAAHSEKILNNGVLTQAPLDLVAQFTAPTRRQTAAPQPAKAVSAVPNIGSPEEPAKKTGFFARVLGAILKQ